MIEFASWSRSQSHTADDVGFFDSLHPVFSRCWQTRGTLHYCWQASLAFSCAGRMEEVSPAAAHGEGGTSCSPKLIIWAHNSHVGDARETEAGWRQKQHNIGQLMREEYGSGDVYIIGFTTHTGKRCFGQWKSGEYLRHMVQAGNPLQAWSELPGAFTVQACSLQTANMVGARSLVPHSL